MENTNTTRIILALGILMLLSACSWADESLQSPADRIQEDQVKVFQDRVVIDVQNAKWANFTGTQSMIPFLDEGSNALQVEPESPEEIEVGDVISYVYKDEVLIHRVIKIANDVEGVYYITQGDNNKNPDPFKIRFSQVKRVLIGVIY